MCWAKVWIPIYCNLFNIFYTITEFYNLKNDGTPKITLSTEPQADVSRLTFELEVYEESNFPAVYIHDYL